MLVDETHATASIYRLSINIYRFIDHKERAREAIARDV